MKQTDEGQETRFTTYSELGRVEAQRQGPRLWSLEGAGERERVSRDGLSP